MFYITETSFWNSTWNKPDIPISTNASQWKHFSADFLLIFASILLCLVANLIDLIVEFSMALYTHLHNLMADRFIGRNRSPIHNRPLFWKPEMLWYYKGENGTLLYSTLQMMIIWCDVTLTEVYQLIFFDH